MMISYCGDLVRKHDPDRFLLSLFARQNVREDLWALYAFNHEVAKTRELVTETQLGLIRLQWWREAIAAIYESKPVLQHPVLQPLAATINNHHLPRELFDNLIFAREFDLEDRLPANIDGMVKYAEFTVAPLMELSLLCHSGESRNLVSDKVATVYALTGILRATPFHLSQRRCYLPENMIPPVQGLYEGKGLEILKDVVKEIIEVAIPAQAGIQKNYKLDSDFRRNGKWLHLHFKLSQMYLQQIKSADYDLFSPELQRPPFLKELRLWRASL